MVVLRRREGCYGLPMFINRFRPNHHNTEVVSWPPQADDLCTASGRPFSRVAKRDIPGTQGYPVYSMVFVLDNYDSFTYNLVQYIGELGAKVSSPEVEKAPRGVGKAGSAKRSAIDLTAICREIVVKRNDEITPEQIVAMRPDRILLSPGPCTPQDAGILVPLIEHLATLPASEQIPVLGVCLGHQAIGAAFGGDVIRAPKLMHGKTSPVVHDNRSVFRDLPQPMTCTRYHSLIVAEESLPAELEISAWTEASVDALGVEEKPIIMGLRHRTLPIEGVQFHPESVLTEHGKRLIENFLRQ